jgi:hypothetical protein
MNSQEKVEHNFSIRSYAAGLLAALLLSLPLSATAETLIMPDRDALVGQDVVVWGVTDQAGNYTLDCGNGDTTSAAIADKSYIPKVCNYAAQGTYTATLTVGAQSDTAQVAVFNGATLSAADLRGVKINMSIEDGLRYLWFSQSNRAANFPAGVSTNWGNGFPYADAAFVALAFENHGYLLPNNNNMPTGIYEKYIVRRALNYVLGSLSAINLTVQAPGNDPCVGPGIEAAPCVGYTTPGDPGYSVAIAVLPFAASGALNRVNTEVPGVTNGKSYGEILQRLTNAEAFGITDTPSPRRGGVYYTFNSGQNDGSTAGWAFLAFLDAEAAGAVVPAWVKTELAFGVDDALNSDGSYDYQGNGLPASNNSVGPHKNGIGLQGLFLMGETAGARVNAVKDNINSWFPTGIGGIGGNAWGQCGPIAGAANYGCAYTMYNNFKGLKLQGIQTLPNVGRPAGPGAIPANDWHESYKDWLLANQVSPTTTTGGSWSTMGFSCCYSGANVVSAIAELLLSEVALVLPDPIEFAKIGLQHCLDGVACTSRTPTVDGEPTEDTNPVGTQHTVVAIAKSINDDPIPGTTIKIDILSGPNAPQGFQGVSNASGEVKISYTSNGVAGTDQLRASIGNLNSNTLTKVWEDQGGGGGPGACDMDQNGKITRSDIRAITRIRGQKVDPAGGPGDYNSDGKVTSRDVKECNKLLGTVLTS